MFYIGIMWGLYSFIPHWDPVTLPVKLALSGIYILVPFNRGYIMVPNSGHLG